VISPSRKLAPIRLWPRVGKRDVLHGLTLSTGAVVRLRCDSDSPNVSSFLASSAIRRPAYLMLLIISLNLRKYKSFVSHTNVR
jgi:hypothetical protein